MHKARLIFSVNNPEIIARSLGADMSPSVKVNVEESKLIIEISEEKLSHLKAIINSYISLVNMLSEVV